MALRKCYENNRVKSTEINIVSRAWPNLVFNVHMHWEDTIKNKQNIIVVPGGEITSDFYLLFLMFTDFPTLSVYSFYTQKNSSYQAISSLKRI